MLLATKSMTISQIAKAAGVPVSTIRFYEREGLINPDARTASNYRAYSAHTAEKLKFIRAAQSTGFQLNDIRGMLELTYSDAPPCDELVTLTRKRLEETRARLKDLKRIEKTLAKSLENCCQGDEPDLCNDLIRLKTGKKANCTTCRK